MQVKRAKTAPTLRDVATVAGVSPYTVSAVLNGARSNTRVSPATRKRIMESAEQLQYVPNAMARGLLARHSSTLGVVFGVIPPSEVVHNTYASAVLGGILTMAERAGYSVSIMTRPWVSREKSSDLFRDGRTDGIVVVAPPINVDILPALAALGVAATVVAGDGVANGYPNVDVDDAVGIRLAVEHILALGHRRVAHLAGDADMVSARVRTEGFLKAMQAAGLAVPSEYVRVTRYSGEGAASDARALLTQSPRPTAIVAANDMIAMSAIQAAHELNIRVPDELSVIGYDDVPAASVMSPGLTTVRQPLTEIGACAAELLIDRTEGRDIEVRDFLFVPELIVRASTGRAPGQSVG